MSVLTNLRFVTLIPMFVLTYIVTHTYKSKIYMSVLTNLRFVTLIPMFVLTYIAQLCLYNSVSFKERNFESLGSYECVLTTNGLSYLII